MKPASGATPVPAPISSTGRRLAGRAKPGFSRMKAGTWSPDCRPSSQVEHRPPGRWRTQISTKPSALPEANE